MARSMKALERDVVELQNLADSTGKREHIQNEGDVASTLNILNVLDELLSAGTDRRIHYLISKGGSEALLSVLVNTGLSFCPNYTVLLPLLHLLAKVGHRDSRIGVKAEETGAVLLTLNLLKHNAKHVKMAAACLWVIQVFSSSDVYRHLHIGNKLDFHRYHWYLWLNRWARAAAGGAVAPSPSSPRLRRPGVRHASTFFWGGRSSSAVPHGVSGVGAFFLLDRGVVSPAGAVGGPLEGTGYGGRRRRLWTRVGTFSRITSATAPAGGTLRSRGGPPWRCASAGA
ncbi:unnamed protein product [Pleuronectes platessa]|uniref:Uncharacterized protein n=1 Tax=Pleuronectes platessa TaxID=8262 RepID=A0A9N7VEK5_PLEPL|nr:unnamed protein product [Pleuronectes platessa]